MVIFVANLNFKLQEADLQKLFEQHGTVASAKIIIDKQTGRSKGYGFVEMPDDSQANTAIATLNGFMLEGKPIAVKEARPRNEAPRRDNFRDRGPRGNNNRYDR